MGRSIAACWLLVPLLACSGSPKPPPQNPTWTRAFDATDTGWLLNVWGPSKDRLFAAGGQPGHGVLVGFDGNGWNPIDLGQDVPLLDWSFGFGPSDVTTVGEQGTVLHFDGNHWSRQQTPTTEVLWGVWGAAPDDLWSVGGGGGSMDVATVLHFDGTTWSALDVTTLHKPGVHAFFKVWGTSASDVFIVGQKGSMLHWDGKVLGEVSTGATDDIISAWGAAGHMLAVGGRSNGQISRFDGTSWTTVSLAGLTGLNGVWTGDGKTFHLAGTEGTLSEVDFDDLLHPQTLTIDRGKDFHCMFGVDGWLFSVGGTLASTRPPYQGIAYELQPQG